MPAKRKTASPKDSNANLGFEAKLWLAADKLRNNMDAAEPERSGGSQPQPARRASEARQYSRAERDRLPKAARRADAEASVNHVVLGLIFLSRAERDRSRASVTRRASRGLRVKYISDSFEEHNAKLVAGKNDYTGANPEDPDEPGGAGPTAAGSPKGERGGANQYRSENIFGVPPAARWSHLQSRAKLLSVAGFTSKLESAR